MTQLLEQAFAKAAQLPPSTQDELAAELMADIESELRWDDAFKNSQDQLARLADKALEEFEAGHTKEMGFDEL